MATMAMDMVQIKKTISVTSFLLLLPLPTLAGDWEFTPKLIADETYTDNVELLANNELSSLVSQVGVALDSKYESRLVDFTLNSVSTYALFSHDHDLDDDFHELSSQISYVLWPNGISLTASANITNQSRNAARNALADIVSGNTVRVENYSSGIAYNVSNSDFNVNSSISYQTTSAEDNIGEREGITAQFNTKNGNSARNVFWDAFGSYQDISLNNIDRKLYRSELKLGWITSVKFNPFVRFYDEDNEGLALTQRTLESNSVGLGFRWSLTPRFFIDLSYNKPVGDQLTLDGQVQDNYVDASINWQPTRRTSLSASISERFFGNSYAFNLSHENRRLRNSISYTESVQTLTRNNFLPELQGIYLCPVDEVVILDECYLSNEDVLDTGSSQLVSIYDYVLQEDYGFSLNKSLRWSSTLTLPRTTFSLNLTGNERESLDATSFDNESKSASFSIKRNVGANSSLTLLTSYTDQVFESLTLTARENRYRQYSIDYNKALSKDITFDLTLSLVNRSSELSYLNYDEQRVSFRVSKGF